MKKSLRAICIGLSLLNCSGLFGQTLNDKDVIPPNVYDSVIKNGSCKIIHGSGNNDYVLLPECEFKKICATNRVEKNAKNFPFTVEMIYKVDKEKPNSDTATVSKIFRSISKMKGMTYFSTTRNKRMVLYKSAYAIENVKKTGSNAAIPDDINGSADGKTILAVMDDASFGKNIYNLSYWENENSIYVKITNEDSMGIGPIRAIRPKDLIMNVIVTDCEDCFVIYLGADTSCAKFPGIEEKLEDSFVSRLDAIFYWFTHQF